MSPEAMADSRERARDLHELARSFRAISDLHQIRKYTRDPAYSVCRCGFEGDGYDAQAEHEIDAFGRVLITREDAAGDPWSDPRFDVWYALWRIEQESESWLRTRDDITVDDIHDTARAAREAFEQFPRDLTSGARWFVHNAIAHPLLVLCPPVGRWLHERTTP